MRKFVAPLILASVIIFYALFTISKNGIPDTKNYIKCFVFSYLGNSASQIQLASMYHQRNRSDDRKNAIMWLRKSASKNNDLAFTWLGWMYQHGEGVDKDMKVGFEWYLKAAESGFADAQYDVANLYRRGEGTQINFKEAEKWYRMAASQNHSLAESSLAHYYEEGIVVKKDLKKAYELYLKAAGHGRSDANVAIGRFYENGIVVEKNQKEALSWYKKAIANNYPEAMWRIGELQVKMHGAEIEKAWDEAEKWFLAAARTYDLESMYKLAVFYHKNQGWYKKDGDSLYWCQRAADQKYPDAIKLLKSGVLQKEAADRYAREHPGSEDRDLFDCSQYKSGHCKLLCRELANSGMRQTDLGRIRVEQQMQNCISSWE